MALKEQKGDNLVRLYRLMLCGMTRALWELFDETSMAITQEIGKSTLKILESDGGMEISGEDPKKILTEIARIFTHEFGLIDNFRIEENDDKIHIYIYNCKLWHSPQQNLKSGIDLKFWCLPLNVMSAALMRAGIRAKREVTSIADTHGSRLTFTLLEDL